jgi:hypothetical protein
MFAVNEGDVDRLVRLVVGLFLLFGVVLGPKSPWCWLGLIPVATALVGFCPLYRLLGVPRQSPQREVTWRGFVAPAITTRGPGSPELPRALGAS